MTYFSGQCAVVTGAGSGIGRALAQSLAAAGARLALADNNRVNLDETIASLPAEARNTIIRREMDVSQRDAVHAFADETASHWQNNQGADIVLNVAGVAQIARVSQLTYHDLDWVMKINYWGMVYGTMAFLPQLRAKGKGHIANVSSVFGLYGVPGQAAYNSSKFAIRGFTEALREEMRTEAPGIHITSIHPGGIKTNIVRNARFVQEEDTEENRARVNTLFDAFARTEPEKAARVILRGLEKRKGRILIGGDARYMDRVVRLFPVRYGRILRLNRNDEESTLAPVRQKEID